MCGGGGTPQYIPPQDNSAQIELQRQQAEEARQAREKQEQIDRYNTAKTGSKTAAESLARSKLTSRGLNVDEFLPLIQAETNRIDSSIPYLDANPGNYYAPDLADTVLSAEEKNRRTKYGQDVSNKWGPGFDTTAIPDTLDDPILNAINDTQYGESLSTLQRAQARGTIGDQGYNEALNKLNAAKPGALSRLQTLGGGILETDRSKIRGIADEAKAGAAGYSLGAPAFSLDPYTSKYDTTFKGINDSLEGDVRNATSGVDLYGINDILSGVARNQPAAAGNSSLADVLAQRKKSEADQRGLGSTGAF